MEILDYKISIGQVFITIFLGLITATIYNKFLSPFMSNFFDYISRIPKFSRNIQIKNMQKRINYCRENSSGSINIVKKQISLISYMIYNLFMFLITIATLSSCQFSLSFIYIISSLKQNIPEGLSKMFSYHYSFSLNGDTTAIYNIYFIDVISVLLCAFSINTFKKILSINIKINDLSDVDKTISVLNKRIIFMQGKMVK